MKFIKAGEIADSNIFNKLDERKKSLLEGGMDVINLSIGTPDFQPGRHVMEAVSRAALDPDMYKYSLNETRELLARLNGRGRIGDVGIKDIRKMRNFIGNRLAGIHERHKPFSDFAALKTSGSNLRELDLSFGNARGFGIDNHDIAVEVTVVGMQSLRF